MKKLALLSLIPVAAAFAAYDGWAEPVLLANGEVFKEYDEPFIALDLDGNYIVVHRYWDGDSDICFTKIDQAGNVLVAPKPIASSGNQEIYPVCVVTNDNTIHVFYLRFDGSWRNYYYVHVSSEGEVIDGPSLFAETLNNGGAGGLLPAITKEADDTIHIAYCVMAEGHNRLGYTRYNPHTHDRLDVWGIIIEDPHVYDQNLERNYNIAVDSEGNAHLFFDQALDFNWMNPTVNEVCWAKVPFDSEGEYESKILSRFLVDGFADGWIRGTIDDDDIIHMIWSGMLDYESGWIYYSMDSDGDEVTGYKKAFPPPWDTELYDADTAYNNGNIAVVGNNNDRLVFGRTDLEGDVCVDFNYISDEVLHDHYYDEVRFIHHNNGFVCIVWPDACDLWYQYTLDGFAADEPGLEAFPDDNGILLSWRENGELIGSVWRLERDGEHLVDLSGNAFYLYLDRDAEPDITHFYTLEATLPDGSVRRFGPVEATWSGPDAGRFTLYAPYPCPATDLVTFSYYLPEGTKNVELSFYDLSGRLVESSMSAPTTPGRHEIAYDTSGLPPGVYIAQLTTDTSSTTKRLTIAR